MEINNLKAQIKTGNFDKWYIFHGDESIVMKIYINKIADKAKLKIVYPDDFGTIFAKSSQKGLLNSSFLYVIVDDKEFLTNEKAWSAVEKIKDDIVIFYYTNTDNRLKFWKNFKDRAVEFEKLDEKVLIKYIQKDIDLSDKNCKKLIDACDGDYGRILLEVDKIKQYSEGNITLIKNRENNAFEILLKEGVIYREPKDAIFDFVKAVLDRDTMLAFNLLEQSYAVGEANLVLLSVLYTNIRNLLMVQNEVKGLNGWAVKNVIDYKDNYSNGELVRAMKLIRKAEKGIKTGTMPDDISVQSILVQIM